MSDECGGCVYWLVMPTSGQITPVGLCRRYAPRAALKAALVLSALPTPGDAQAVWPLTQASDGCGEFQAVPPPVKPAVVDTPAVLVDGAISPNAVVGQVLTCTMGNWSGEPTSFVYAWRRDLVAVAEGAMYTLVEADAGHSITCVVTASNLAGEASAPPSNAVTVAAA